MLKDSLKHFQFTFLIYLNEALYLAVAFLSYWWEGIFFWRILNMWVTYQLIEQSSQALSLGRGNSLWIAT
jgi:hypothetical protein